VKKNEKKEYNSFRDDVYSIKELIEEKRKEIRELESKLRNITKINSDDDNEESERDKIKRQIKRMEKELKNLQRKL
jgi:DNA-binding transcriptional regulator GbsR (MarR family)